MPHATRLRWVFIGALLAAGTSWACVNETGTNRSGAQIWLDMTMDEFRRALVTPLAPTRDSLQWARRVTAEARAEPDFDNLNQLGVVLMRLGRPADAAALFERVERKFPGHWETAPNLGTAYELAGDDVSALRWIREGMTRNAEDHYGSEWLHAAILSAKIEKRERVLDLDFGDGALPRAPVHLPRGNDGRPVTRQDLRQALEMQALERIQFVRAPDPRVAELLFSWAQLELLDGAMEHADLVYAAAGRYGWPDAAAIARGRADAKAVLVRAKASKANG